MIWLYEIVFGFSAFLFGLMMLNTFAPNQRSWVQIGFAFPLGFAIFSLVVLLHLLFSVPITLWSMCLSLILIFAGMIGWILKSGKLKLHNIPLPVLVGILTITIVALVQQNFHFLILSYDSYTYAVLSGNATNSIDGITHPSIAGYITSYAPMVPFGNALAGLWGRDMVSISPLLFSLSIISMIFGVVLQFTQNIKLPVAHQYLLAFGAISFLIATPQYLFHSFYFMPNLPMATYVLCAIIAMWQLANQQENGWIWLLGFSLLAIGFCRLEGGLFVIVLGLAFSATSIQKPWQRFIVYLGVGATLAAWLFFLSALAPAGKATGILSANAAIAQSILLFTPAIAAAFWKVSLTKPLVSFGAKYMAWVLVLAGLVLFLKDVPHGQENLLNWAMNVSSRIGLWGWSWMGICIAILICHVFGRPLKNSTFFASAMLSLILLTINLGLFRDFPYRLGAQDSGNRLMLQIFPSIVLFTSLWISQLVAKVPAQQIK